MVHPTALIAELVKAANETGTNKLHLNHQLIERAIVAICELSEVAELRSNRKVEDAVAYLQGVELQISRSESSDHAVRSALLFAAGMIRELHIILSDLRS